jgi:hypothetical protein
MRSYAVVDRYDETATARSDRGDRSAAPVAYFQRINIFRTIKLLTVPCPALLLRLFHCAILFETIFEMPPPFDLYKRRMDFNLWFSNVISLKLAEIYAHR